MQILHECDASFRSNLVQNLNVNAIKIAIDLVAKEVAMSRISILGTIENIRSRSSVYTPLIEAIINSVDSIVESEVTDGNIEIVLIRQRNLAFDDIIQNVESIEIKDNGIGFNQKHRDSFDTFYSEQKKREGGKGFGRFLYLKYFNQVKIDSTFKDETGAFYSRKFNFGKQYEIIVDEKIEKSEAKQAHTTVYLNTLKDGNHFDKNLETISRKILEKILILFIDDSFKCPTITIREDDRSQSIVLNHFLKDLDSEIQLISGQKFELAGEKEGEIFGFNLKIFKLYFPGNMKSKVSLTAHKREVTDNHLHVYYPEFEDDFYDEFERKDGSLTKKNYIIKSYILGK